MGWRHHVDLFEHHDHDATSDHNSDHNHHDDDHPATQHNDGHGNFHPDDNSDDDQDIDCYLYPTSVNDHQHDDRYVNCATEHFDRDQYIHRHLNPDISPGD